LNIPSFVEVKIYTFQGQLIKTLVSEKKEMGSYQCLWDGNDHNGKETEAGPYLIRLIANRNIITRSIEKL
jgi:flagellar hook assembly protein FlgD